MARYWLRLREASCGTFVGVADDTSRPITLVTRAVIPRAPLATGEFDRTFAALPAPVASVRVRRSLHPWAWWAWAMSLAIGVSLVRNPLLLALFLAAVMYVVVARRSDAVWARSLRAYATLAAMVFGIRLFFQITLGGLRDGTVLFTLPSLALPDWAAGIQLGGPVTAEALWFVLCDAGRLAVLLCCVGAANTLANPRRALRNVPRSLYRLATAVVIAVTVAPQLIESAQRVRRAQRLRGASTRSHAVRRLVVPVIEDAIERSMSLAASMESRGFGRTSATTKLRTDPWRWPETLTVACGVIPLAIVIWLRHAQPDAVWPPASPIITPMITVLMLVAVVIAALPAFFTPIPSRGDA